MDTEYLQLSNRTEISSRCLTYDVILPDGDLLDETDTWALVGKLIASEIDEPSPRIQIILFERFFQESDLESPSLQILQSLLPSLIDTITVHLTSLLPKVRLRSAVFFLHTPFGTITSKG